jgi:hypothetical protein
MDTPGTPDRFRTERFSAADYAIHIGGGVVNLAVLAAGGTFLVINARVLAGGWVPWVLTVAALAVATFVADFVSGVLHWSFDTYFSDRNDTIKRMVVLVREHHIYPERIFQYSVWREAGMLSWFGALLAAPPIVVAFVLPGPAGAWQWALAVLGVTVSLQITFMLEFHKAGHRRQRGRITRLLQAARLLLSPEQHLQHHAGEHDTHYCLINGVADDTLGRLGAFRGLEALVTAVTGAVPREHDRVLRAEFGKPVR